MRRLHRCAPFFLVASLLLPARAHAQESSAVVRDIAGAIARRDTAGPLTVAGRATVTSGQLQTGAFDIAIQDGTGGIRIYSRSPQAMVREGDSVEATGVIKGYRGNLELVATR